MAGSRDWRPGPRLSYGWSLACSRVCTFTLRVVTQTGAFGEPWYLAALGDLAFFMLPTVGLVIAVRRPKLVFGWLMLVAGFAFAGGELAHGYATQALLDPGTLPGGMVTAFLQTLQLIGFVLLPLLLLLFPNGRLPTPRWTPLAWAAVACPVLMLPALLLTPGLMLDGVPASRNPFGLQALEGTDVVGPLFAAWYLILLLALVSLLLRFRRARGEQRQQLKWVMLGGGLFPISFFIEDLGNPSLNAVADLLAITAFCGAIGVAILKYRLYDIDRIINRTLVYGLLSVLLGLGYAAVVLGLGGCCRKGRAWPWPGPRLPWPPCSSRPGVASSESLTAASTGVSTTRPRPSRRSVPGCATRSTWTPCRPSCWPSPTKPCSQRRCRCGFDHRMKSRNRTRCIGTTDQHRTRSSTLASLRSSATRDRIGRPGIARPILSLTPCLPCSFGLLPYPRSGSRSPAQRSSRVTVIDRCIPPVTAAYGTRVARPARTTRLAPEVTGPQLA